MNNEVIYVCHSTNNKNVRANELEVLRKYEDKLYFEFGENENNIKKRFYDDTKTLNKDFEAILKIKDNLAKEEKEEIKEDNITDEEIEEKFIEKIQELPKIEEIEEEKEVKRPIKKIHKKYNKKDLF